MNPRLKTFLWFLAAFIISFCGMVAWNDLIFNFSWDMRFLSVLAGVILFFVIPATIRNFRHTGMTPAWLDAGLVPFLAVMAHGVVFQKLDIYLFYEPLFWMILGLPSFFFSYYLIGRKRLHRLSSLPVTLGMSFLVFLIMVIFFPAMYS